MNYKSIFKTFTFLLLLNTACQNKIYKQKTQITLYNLLINYKIKRLFNDDTLSKNYHIQSFQRNDSQKTLLFAKFYPENKAYFEILQSDTLYFVDTKHKKVYVINPLKNSKDLFYKIIKLNRLTATKLQSNSGQLITKNDTLIKINPDTTAVYKYVFFKDGKLKFTSALLKFKTYHQYEAYSFKYSKQQYIQHLSTKDTLKNLFKKYKITDIAEFKKNTFKEKKYSRFPVLKGTFFNKHPKPAKTGLTLYEYWHTSCYPCILSIPDLEYLQKKYPKKLKIVGVNQVDKDSLRVLNFIKKHQINYEIILTRNDSLTYSYPTYFLVNSNRKILVREEGYNKKIIKTLDSIIQHYHQ